MMAKVIQYVFVALVVNLDVTLYVVFAKNQDKYVTVAAIQKLHEVTNKYQL